MAATTPPVPVQIAPVSAASTHVSAAGGWLAWGDTEQGRPVLKLRSPAGAVTDAPNVPAGARLDDVTLGVRRSGQVVAAFDVCARTHRCHIALQDVATGATRTLSLSKGSRSDELPAVSGDTLAFLARGRGSVQRVATRDLKSARLRTRFTLKPSKAQVTAIRTNGSDVAALAEPDFAPNELFAQSGRGKARVIDEGNADGEVGTRIDDFVFDGRRVVTLVGGVEDGTGRSFWNVYRQPLSARASGQRGPFDDFPPAADGTASAAKATSVALSGTQVVVAASSTTRPFGIYAYPATFVSG